MKDNHIYHIYKDCADEVHCQRYPIIYSNDEYIYYKTYGCKELTKIEVYRVRKAYSTTLELGYFLTKPPEHIRGQFPNQRIILKMESLKVGIRQHQREIEYYTQRVEEQRQRMEDKINLLKSLEQESQMKEVYI